MQGIGAVQAGETVRIEGTVQMLTVEQIRQAEAQFGVDLDEILLLNLAGQAPLIVAQRASK